MWALSGGLLEHRCNGLSAAFRNLDREARGHLENSLRNALLMRWTIDFVDLAAYRSFRDEIVGRKNARNRQRTDAERAVLKPLPDSCVIQTMT